MGIWFPKEILTQLIWSWRRQKQEAALKREPRQQMSGTGGVCRFLGAIIAAYCNSIVVAALGMKLGNFKWCLISDPSHCLVTPITNYDQNTVQTVHHFCWTSTTGVNLL